MALSRVGLTFKRGSAARCILPLGVLLLLAGCATSGPLPHTHSHQQGAGSQESLADDGGGFGLWEEKPDHFQLLQQSAGLEKDGWHEVGEELETDDARELLETLARTRTVRAGS